MTIGIDSQDDHLVSEAAPAQPPRLSARFFAFLRDEALIVSVVAGTFFARFLLAGWNSYWLDELISVTVYGNWNESVSDAIRQLAEESVHPPLYQFVLYNWMNWFGDTETATRTLSNIYVSLAVLVLYLALREFCTRRVAVTAAIGFAVMYSTMYYGLETRSYAQTILLVTLSSYLLLRLFKRGAVQGWRSSLVSWPSAFFILTNAAVLLTHYYNVFFVGAQALMALIFILREFRPRRWIGAFGAISLLFAVPVGVFALVWGRVAMDTFIRLAADFAVEGASDVQGPIDLFRGAILRDNISAPRYVLIIGASLGLWLLVRVLISLKRASRLDPLRLRNWSTLYFLCWTIVPLVLVYLAFRVAGIARYNNRYFIFSVVPLAPLIVLSVEELWSQIMVRLKRPLPDAWLAMVYLPIFVSAILPGSLGASSYRKADWRGTAEEIVDIIDSSPDTSFAVFETSFGQRGVLDYYLSRFDDQVRVTSTITRHQEASGGPFFFETDRSLLAEADYMIVPFIHHRTKDFPIALGRLDAMYEAQFWKIGPDGRGLVIFATGNGE